MVEPRSEIRKKLSILSRDVTPSESRCSGIVEGSKCKTMWNKIVNNIGLSAIRADKNEGNAWEDFRMKRKWLKIKDVGESLDQVFEWVVPSCFDPKWMETTSGKYREGLRQLDGSTSLDEISKRFDEMFKHINWKQVQTVEKLNSLMNQMPTSEVTNQTWDYWNVQLVERMQNAVTPKLFSEILHEINGLIKKGSSLVLKGWAGERAAWTKGCKECNTWKDAKDLLLKWEIDAIDWDEAVNIFNTKKQPEDEPEPKPKAKPSPAAKKKAAAPKSLKAPKASEAGPSGGSDAPKAAAPKAPKAPEAGPSGGSG
ncbi:hypothetical protein T484DRAFT_1886028, partial [Baffinella frigidus]